MPQTNLIERTLAQIEELIQDRRYNEAIMALEKISRADTNNPKVLASLCATYMHLGMMPDARKAAQRWAKMDARSSMAQTTLGSLRLHHRSQWYGPGFDLERALTHLNRAIELDPENESACQMAGLACFHQEALEDAAHYMRLASEINPMQAQHHYWLGRIAFRLNDSDEAISNLNRTVRLNANHPQAYRFLGWVHYERREWKKSVAAYERAILISPADATPYLRLGLIYGIHQHHFKKATEHFRLVINRFPDWVPGYTGLADTHREQKKFTNAIAWYIRALQKDCSTGYALVQLYHLFRDIGEEQTLREIAQLGAKGKTRQEYEEMDYVDRARFFAMLGKTKTAHQLLDQYAKEYPSGKAASILNDYRILLDQPKALYQVDKTILRKIKSKLTPQELEGAKKARKTTKPSAKSAGCEPTGFFTHEYVLLRQFDWEPTAAQREEALAHWCEFYATHG